MSSIVIVLPKIEDGKRIRDILAKRGYEIDAVCSTAAAALGEMTYGVAKGMKNFIMLTLGTGVGSGIVVNGQLVYGSDGFAGELGHVVVNKTGRICGCGRKGCLETYASATGIKRTVFKLLADHTDDSEFRRVT